MKHIEIFTDGACQGNPGPGGWGALLRYQGSEKTLSGAALQTTNNRMELQATIGALEALTEPCYVSLSTDSKYVQLGITQYLTAWKKNGWQTMAKKAVKNADLWQHLDKVSSCHKVDWYWVKGHSGHLENELVDKLAREALKTLLRNTSEAK